MTWRAAPIFGVSRVRSTAEYYRDVLGFTLDPVDGVFQPSADEPEGVYAIVRREELSIHFQIRRPAFSSTEFSHAERPTFERDAYLYVADVIALFTELSNRGARIIEPLHSTSYGIVEFVIEDLNGFRIAFGQIVP